MPLLFQVARDHELGNPNVRVRRTAVQKAPIRNLNCYLSIEFNWFESGALAVVTSVNPVDPDNDLPSGLTPFFDHAELRVFSRAAAERLSLTADKLAQGLDHAFFPDNAHFRDPPMDFLDPPDDYYSFSIREPSNPTYQASLLPAYIQTKKYEDETFHVQTEIPHEAGDLTRTKSIPHAGASLHSDRGDVSSVAEQGTVQLWSGFQTAVAHSRRKGIVNTMMAKKQGGRFAQVVNLFGQETHYTFLSTYGINVHGRIQRLCSQLGIESCSPMPDSPLLDSSRRESLWFKGHRRDIEPTLMGDIESELDITTSIYGRNSQWKKRRFGDDASDHAPDAYPSDGDSAVPMWPSESRLDLPSCTPSASTHGREASPDRESADGPSMKFKKRRRSSLDLIEHSSTGNEDRLVGEVFFNRSQTSPEPVAVEVEKEVPFQMADETVDEKERIEIAEMLINRSNAFDATGMSSPKEELTAPAVIDPSNDRSPHNGSPLMTGANESPATPAFSMGVDTKTIISTPKGCKTVWTCDRCGVKIRGKKGNLNRHIANKHDNIRAYACDFPECGKSFQTRLNLKRHIEAVHKGRPHKCSGCPRAFKDHAALQDHIKNAHEEIENTLACDICGKCFGRRSTLNRHKTKVHKPAGELDGSFVIDTDGAS